MSQSLPEVFQKSTQSWRKVDPQLAQSRSKVGPKLVQGKNHFNVSPKLAKSQPTVFQSGPKVPPKSTKRWPSVGPKVGPKSSKVGPETANSRFKSVPKTAQSQPEVGPKSSPSPTLALPNNSLSYCRHRRSNIDGGVHIKRRQAPLSNSVNRCMKQHTTLLSARFGRELSLDTDMLSRVVCCSSFLASASVIAFSVQLRIVIFFLWGLRHAGCPSRSALLPQPPQAICALLSQVGYCRSRGKACEPWLGSAIVAPSVGWLVTRPLP